jgi:hypothetical protein
VLPALLPVRAYGSTTYYGSATYYDEAYGVLPPLLPGASHEAPTYTHLRHSLMPYLLGVVGVGKRQAILEALQLDGVRLSNLPGENIVAVRVLNVHPFLLVVVPLLLGDRIPLLILLIQDAEGDLELVDVIHVDLHHGPLLPG